MKLNKRVTKSQIIGILMLILIAAYFLTRPIIRVQVNRDINLGVKAQVYELHETIIDAIMRNDLATINSHLSAEWLNTGTDGKDLIAKLERYLWKTPDIYEEFFFNVVRSGIGNKQYESSKNSDYILKVSIESDTYIIFSTISLNGCEYLLKSNYVQNDGVWKLGGFAVAAFGYNGLRIRDLISKALIAQEEGSAMSAYLYSILANVLLEPFDFVQYRDLRNAKTLVIKCETELRKQAQTSFDTSYGEAVLVDVRMNEVQNGVVPFVYFRLDDVLADEASQLGACNEVLEQFASLYPDVLENFGTLRAAYVID